MTACRLLSNKASLMPWLRALSCTALLACVAGECQAEMLLSQTNLVIGSQTTTTTFTTSGAGTVTVQLTDLSWPERLASLSFAVVNSTTVLARSVLGLGTSGLGASSLSTSGISTLSFDVSGPGTYTAIVSGAVAPSNALQLGAYSLQCDLTPSAVAIPASGILLSTALVALMLLRLRRVRGNFAGIMATA
jgi:hypothetical protein